MDRARLDSHRRPAPLQMAVFITITLGQNRSNVQGRFDCRVATLQPLPLRHAEAALWGLALHLHRNGDFGAGLPALDSFSYVDD